MESAELINNELKRLNRMLKSNKISINAGKTKCMLFSDNKKATFSIIKKGNDKINETSFSKFLGIHLDKKNDFVNHITEMSIKVAKSIGLLNKLNRFPPESILKTLYISLIQSYLSYGIEAWHGTYIEIIPLKSSFSRRKPYMYLRAINNLAYNEHSKTYFKCNKILKLF